MMKAISIIPCLSYHDAAKAIDWLCQAFGFKKHQVFEEDGIVVHAELTLGKTMIMLASEQRVSEFSKRTRHPDQVGGFETQTPYVILADEDIEAHYQNAKEHGANMLLELKTEDYGGRNYACYDLEGHLWSFGSYNPWDIDQ